MDHAETVAKAVVETLEAGSEMRYQTKQSEGEHDFDLVFRDGRVATLEVTASADEDVEGTVAAVRDPRKGGSFVQTKLCKHDWRIHPEPRAVINKIRSQADQYLAQVEADGLTTFSGPLDAAEHECVRRIWGNLGIVSGSVFKWKPPGQIGISMPSGGGRVGAEALSQAIHSEAYKADNIRKLGVAKAREAHLFVYVHPRNYLAWVVLLDCDPPPEPVVLPQEITLVWAATEGRSRDEFAVWRARRDEPWHNCGPLSLNLSHSSARE